MPSPRYFSALSSDFLREAQSYPCHSGCVCMSCGNPHPAIDFLGLEDLVQCPICDGLTYVQAKFKGED